MNENQEPESVFERFVHDAERAANENLGRYKVRLSLFALLGYVVIFALVGLLIALVGGVVAASLYSTALLILLVKKKILFVLLPAIWILLKSLWVKLEPPSGYTLNSKSCPSLFDEIDQLRKELKALRIHEVILTPELNAAISQTPRLGVFGWQKNTLILGLELLLTLTPAQARAVIAHEFGHLSGNHSRFSGWIYRVRQSWQRIMLAYHEESSLGARMMRPFFDWYAPRFAAYSFVLARRNEYEADAIAAELTSAEDTSAALVTTHVTGPYIDENYWTEYFKRADDIAQPEHLPWAGLSQFLATHKLAQADLKAKLAEALATETDLDDTHPSLSDRVNALASEATLPEAVRVTAAHAWLGEQFESIINDFDRDWLQANEQAWTNRFEYVAEGRNKLEFLKARDRGGLSNEEIWEYATLSEEFASPQSCFELFKEYERREPNDPDVAFKLGQLLFDKDDDACLTYFKKALERPNLIIAASRYAYYYLSANERSEEAQWWLDQAEHQATIDSESEAERATLDPKDPLDKADLSPEQLEALIELLGQYPELKNAWIARKRMQHYPEVPAIAIAVSAKGLFENARVVSEKMLGSLELDYSFFVVPKNSDYSALAKAIIRAGDKII